ncbi:MAG: M15 family metallopeptidase [Candidatus Pacebacteria bacterium]|nr:M15 family metallopeptidase [Candidatus Paceibacterota bacterium]
MKNFFKYSAVALVGVFVASFFTIPAFNQEVRYFILANVVGGQFCPQGDGKTFDNELLVHVNKNIALPLGYIPEKLVDISKEIKSTQRICLKREALDALKVMFADAQAQDINLAVTSAFRSSQTQSNLFKALYALKGEKAKDRIAPPSHSEHQLGTTVDLSGKSINYVSASDRFTGTAEELWLRANAHKYGFVQSYPKGKTPITGYDHESWHYRFLGTEVASKIFEEGVTIEEYFISLDVDN